MNLVARLRETFIPLRFKLLASFLVLLVPVLGLSLYIVSRIETSQTQVDTRMHLEVTRSVAKNLLRFRRKALESSLDVMVDDTLFKQALALKDPEATRSSALNLQKRAGAAALWVTDEAGNLVADTRDSVEKGTSLKSLPVVAGALKGEKGDSIELMGGKAYQLVASPVRTRKLIGVLVATFAIDDALAGDIKRLSLSEISFAAGGKVIGSTLDPHRRQVLEASMPAMFEQSRSYLIGPTGDRQIVLPSRVGLVNVYTQRSWEETQKPLARQQRAVLLIGLAAVVLSILAGFLLAESFTSSISQLQEATQRLVSGDYDVQVALEQRDEIGLLGRDFNSLVHALKERENMRSLLHKVVSREIAEELLKPGKLNLGGEERTISILFADIRGFTAISEGMNAPDLVKQLNRYFKDMTRAIDSQSGIIDKYIGDAIMALFGAPLATYEDADNALNAALAIVEAMSRHNKERAEHGLTPWRNGVGVNTGIAVAGAMGSEDRLSYTVVGDSVNIASRLEKLTKYFGVPIVVSGATKAAARSKYVYRSLDLVRVRGKSDAVSVFELLSKGENKPDWLDSFEDGVLCFRQADLVGAKVRFERVLTLKPDDSPSRLYLGRIGAMLENPPPVWDPAHSIEGV